MAKIKTIKKGASVPFSFDLDGASLTDYVCTIVVKQYPDDTASVDRVVASSLQPDGSYAFSGFLTSTETSTLADGMWIINADMVKASTLEQTTKQSRFQVSADWDA